MNLTVSNLKLLTKVNHLQSSFSPLFANNNFIKLNIFHNIILNFFISSFLYTSTGISAEYSIKKSKFQNFLKPSIFFQSNESLIKIKDNIFQNCKQRAINIKERSAHTIISNCIFENCQISKNGGAIFSKSQKFECEYCCFYHCTTVFEGWWGSAIYVFEANQSKIYQISVFQCPPPQQERPDMDSQVSIFKGYTDCRFHNYTSGKHRFSSGIRLSHTEEDHSILKFILTCQHKSGNALAFVRIYFKGDFSHINLINNSCNLGMIYLSMTDLFVSNSIFANNYGNITYMHADARISLISCVIDKDDIIFNDFVVTKNCTLGNSTIQINLIKLSMSCDNRDKNSISRKR
ncbi:hypothetical protein M9Y10_028896 [Tritrichomonas musculus]|uniref:Right handed beta helix domain-containing protein n=1 Tax=Tritrichomonas musculus TaxID=1915356 RepID=A0ABR2KLH4_9EUKA